MIRLIFLIHILLSICAAPVQANLFGVPAQQRSDGLANFVKWQNMLQRKDADRGPRSAMISSGKCIPNPRFICTEGKNTSDFISSLRYVSRIEQMRQVNTRLNAARYITDPTNWGVDDYWATLAQFLRRDGDCEDYAIAKYMLLKQLGVPIADMRVVIVMDLNLNIPHAILAVNTETETYILDNQNTDIVLDSSIRHYRPYYSINEQAWWVYRPKINHAEAR
jgi:predicted transglutaminase-like cysteine proteinase